jgi:hypothetical protein
VPSNGEIAVKFDHGVVRFDEIVAVDLDFVVVLGLRGCRGNAKRGEKR